MATATQAQRTEHLQREKLERLYYLISGFLILAAVLVGFRFFYMHGQASGGGPITPQIVPLVVLHGILMSCWITLFIAQSGLIVARKTRTHMSLGVVGVVLYFLILTVGTVMGVLSMHYSPLANFGPWGPRKFLTVPLTALCGFGLLVGIALLYRRKPAVHRPLMLLGTLFAASAGIDRIQTFTHPFDVIGHGSLGVSIWGPALAAALLLWPLKLAMTRRWDRYYAAGFAALATVSMLSALVSATMWWDRLAAVIIQR